MEPISEKGIKPPAPEPEEKETGDYNAADRASVNKARKKAARKEAEKNEIVRKIMDSKDGRAWMYGYLTMCKTFTSPFSENPHQTDFNCGAQHIGHMLMADIMGACPEQYWKMVTEKAND